MGVKVRRWSGFPILLLAIWGFVSAAPVVTGEKEAAQGLQVFEDRFEAISVRMGEAYWDYYTKSDDKKLAGPKQEFAELFADPALKRLVAEWYPQRDKLEDQVFGRRLSVWKHMLLFAEVECSPEIAPLKLTLESLMGVDTASEAQKKEDPEALLRRLMKLRNEKVKALGFKEFGSFMLDITETDAAWFDDFVATVEKATRAPYRQLLESLRTQKGGSEPTMADLLSLMQEARFNGLGVVSPEERDRLAKEAVGQLGFAPETVPTLVEYPLPAGIGGQGFAIRVPDDIRVVVSPRMGLTVRLHEIGHALHYRNTRITWPSLKGYEWCFGNVCPAYEEGMAQVMAKLTENFRWLERNADRKAAELRVARNKSIALAPLALRMSLARGLLEIETYRHLDRDPKDVARELSQRLLLVAPAEGESHVSLVAAAYPVYLQNYLLGDVVAFTVHRALEEKFGKGYASDNRVGPFLQDALFKDGSLRPWREQLRQGLGRDLDVKGYLASLGL